MRIYLDHQSTTPLDPQVRAAMAPFGDESFGNPSSLHTLGVKARDAIQQAREQVASLIGASPNEIIFTSSGTEAINLAIKGSAWANRARGRHLVCIASDHVAVLQSMEFLSSEGFSITTVPVDSTGLVDPEAIGRAITPQTILISVHHVNHEIGTIQDLPRIAALGWEQGIPVFVDALASAGWLPINVESLGLSYVALAPHRFYGPKGIGVLYRNRRARLVPLLHGGNQEEGRRASTENVAGIVGAGVAAVLARQALPGLAARLRPLQAEMWQGLQQSIPGTHLNGAGLGDLRSPANLNVSFEGVEGEGITLLADLQDLAIASGSACTSQNLKISHVLEAIGLDPGLAQGNIVISLGRETLSQEIQIAISILQKCVVKLRAMSPGFSQ